LTAMTAGMDPSAVVGWGDCAIVGLRHVLEGDAADRTKLRAVESLGYVARSRLHLEAARLLRWTIETREGPLRTAALDSLRAAGLSTSSDETEMNRYARHANPAIRSALIDVIDRDCDQGDRSTLELGLAAERDPALITRWRAALERLAACGSSPTDRGRDMIARAMGPGGHLQAALCNPSSFVADDHFEVENATGDRRGPHASARRAGDRAVRALPEFESLISHLQPEYLHCLRDLCIHGGRINSYDFAFWFEHVEGAQAVCLSRIVRTAHQREPELID
jgi:hypothetical protein